MKYQKSSFFYKYIIGILLTVLLIGSEIFAQVSESSTKNEADEVEWEKIRALKEIYQKAATTGNVSVLKPYLSEKFTIATLTGEDVLSFEEFETYTKKIHELLGDGATHDLEIKYLPGHLNGDVAIAHGSTNEKVVTSLKNEFKFSSLWTAILLKEQGSWKIFRIHVSMDPVNNSFVTHHVGKQLRWYFLVAGAFGLFIGVILTRIFWRK